LFKQAVISEIVNKTVGGFNYNGGRWERFKSGIDAIVEMGDDWSNPLTFYTKRERSRPKGYGLITIPHYSSYHMYTLVCCI